MDIRIQIAMRVSAWQSTSIRAGRYECCPAIEKLSCGEVRSFFRRLGVGYCRVEGNVESYYSPQSSLRLNMSLMLDQILNLSVAERIMLVEAIWDSIPEEQSGAALSEETKQLLDQRLAAHRANPDSGSSWEEVKERIQEQL